MVTESQQYKLQPTRPDVSAALIDAWRSYAQQFRDDDHISVTSCQRTMRGDLGGYRENDSTSYDEGAAVRLWDVLTHKLATLNRRVVNAHFRWSAGNPVDGAPWQSWPKQRAHEAKHCELSEELYEMFLIDSIACLEVECT
jgi:hypothetical protein